MKKLTILVLMVSACIMLSALELNVLAGLGISSITGDETDDYSSKIGWSVGASVDLPMGNNLIIEPGVRFFGGGATAEFTDNDEGYKVKYENTLTLNYFDIFAKAKYKIGDIQPYIGLGLPILMSADSEVKISSPGGSFSGSEDVGDSFTSLNFNIMLGADYILMDKFTIGVEYSRTLNNILDVEGNFSQNLNNIMLNVGYKFNF